jgi:hypothetical protein
VDALNAGVECLVASITQPPLASTSVVESPCQSPRLKTRPLLSDVAAAVKLKQRVLGFKLDDKTIYAWFRDDLESFSTRNSSWLKRTAVHNFKSISCDERQIQAVPGKSQRIATQSPQPNKQIQSKPTKSQRGLWPLATIPPSIPLTSPPLGNI